MPRQKEGDRVIGVYGRRVVHVDNGERRSDVFPTEEKAKAHADGLRAGFIREALTVEKARDAWLKDLKVTPRTLGGYRERVGYFCPNLGLPLVVLTAAKCEALYQSVRERYESVASQHNAFVSFRLMARWCVAKGHLKKDPFAGMKLQDTPSRGKYQLTLDEARLLYARVMGYALDPGHKHREKAALVVSSLLLGTRISELTNRLVRDLDDGGRVLSIPYGKTKAAKRRLVLPDELRPLFARQVQDKTPLARLFSSSGGTTLYHLGVWCAEAGVPVVCLHSLRGLHADLAVAEGQTGAVVARTLGQTSFTQVTVPHYLKPGTVESTRVGLVTPMFTQKEK